MSAHRYRIYDPLTDAHIPLNHEQQVTSYWRAHPTQPEAPVTDNCNVLPAQCETLIIGAGYTGLNAALTLAEHGHNVVVIDAGAIAAGCSSRNAGFVLPASGRLSIQNYSDTFGADVAAGVLNEFNAGVRHVEQLAARMHTEHGVDCQYAASRYLRIAHNSGQVAPLQQLADNHAPWPRQFLTAADLQHQLPGVRHAHGALEQTPAGRVHPLALAQGYAQLARAAGARIVTQCAALNITELPSGCDVATSQGHIRAEHVMLCSNGYANRQLFSHVTTRQLPALSSIGVTQPLSRWQVEQLGLTPNDLVMDTRRLKYYYRLLPDQRLLFGGRGAISGKDAQHPKYQAQLHQAMLATLPVLRGVGFKYAWSGWVSVTLDSYPRSYQHSQHISAALGYCGAGISFASLAGKRLAQRRLGHTLPPLPFYQRAPLQFSLPGLRRTGQRLYYQYARLRDNLNW